jgi:hypothetical protein
MCRPKGLSHGRYNQSRGPHLPSSAVQVCPFSGRGRTLRLRTAPSKVGLKDCSRFLNARVTTLAPLYSEDLRGGARTLVVCLQATELCLDVYILDISSYPVRDTFFSPPFVVSMLVMCDAFLVLDQTLLDQSLPYLCISSPSFVRALFTQIPMEAPCWSIDEQQGPSQTATSNSYLNNPVSTTFCFYNPHDHAQT